MAVKATRYCIDKILKAACRWYGTRHGTESGKATGGRRHQHRKSKMLCETGISCTNLEDVPHD